MPLTPHKEDGLADLLRSLYPNVEEECLSSAITPNKQASGNGDNIRANFTSSRKDCRGNNRNDGIRKRLNASCDSVSCDEDGEQAEPENASVSGDERDSDADFVVDEDYDSEDSSQHDDEEDVESGDLEFFPAFPRMPGSMTHVPRDVRPKAQIERSEKPTKRQKSEPRPGGSQALTPSASALVFSSQLRVSSKPTSVGDDLPGSQRRKDEFFLMQLHNSTSATYEKFHKQFNKNKLELTGRLFTIFNENIFCNKVGWYLVVVNS